MFNANLAKIKENMQNLMEITDDLFDVAWRLKAVDGDYRLCYNVKASRYEVYGRKNNQRAFVVPFDELDARTVDYARRTRAENIARLVAEMDRENAETDKRNVKAAAEQYQRILEEL